ncbi:SAV_2336 N-terminal domain-related protein [Streptomyces luteogriseus]|uniref:SAV_2336 N-terminal domain-related protein n=1 Tax=Streptomyces luteogriseus TaxID=68233 RepID=UPI0033C3DEEB
MSDQAAHSPPGDANRALTALVARMRDAGIGPSVEELADALWLAHWLPAQAEPSLSAATDRARPSSSAPDEAVPRPAPVRRPPEPDDEPQQSDGARLFVPGPGTSDGVRRMEPIGVPAAPALPEPLSLQRGLRPLQRYRAPIRPVPRVLDEHATAHRAAESRLLLPVLRPDRRREARLLLLMDVSTSTVVWQEALEELRQICARAGAFGEVRMRYLHETPGGLPGCAATPDARGPQHAPEQLSDPTGRCVTLMLSDCAGPMWRSGHMQRLLHRWAATGPVAVVQPLPQRMWLRTHLPARRGLLHRREGPVGTLEFRPDRGRRPGHAALPVPVLAPRRESVEGWARLVSGATGQSLAAAAGWVHPDHPPSGAVVRAAEEVTAKDRVHAFWRPASSEARRLAVYLSAVPLYLPVMQLVQHAMLAGSGPDVLSEVLLSGLLRRRDYPDDPQAVRYEFLPQVASELRSKLAVDDAELLFKHCSEYVERRFGRSVRNFPALAGAFLRGSVTPGADLPTAIASDEGEPVGLRAFAEVSAEVLRDLGRRMPAVAVRAELSVGELLALGREALGTFRREGLTRELDAAVGYLRQALEAAEAEADRDLAAVRLADALWSRWQVRGVGEDLREAWQAIGDFEGLSGWGRVVRSRVCLAQAMELSRQGLGFDGVPDGLRQWAVEAAHDEHRAEDFAGAVLLYLADLDLTSALHDPETAAEHRHGTALALTHLRRFLADSGAETAGADSPYTASSPEDWYITHLQRAVEAADVALDASQDETTHAMRGRLWLDLACQYGGHGRVPATPDERRAADAALLATDDFLAAVRDESALPGPERCTVWLDMVSAIEIHQPPREDGRERRSLLDAVAAALEAAGDDEGLKFECHARAAALYRARYDRSGDPRQLDRAVAAWSDAEPLLDEDDPRRPEVLSDFGRALLERASTRGLPDDVARAIDLLRRAVDTSLPDDPRLPMRRQHLGSAHFLRFGQQEVLSDLYEAEWLFGEAARGSDDPHFLGQCWLNRGATQEFLHSRTSGLARLHQAVDCYTRAAGHAREAGDDEMCSIALQSRGQVHERLGRTRSAQADYRAALPLSQDSGRSDHLRSRVAHLETGAAAE